MPLQILQPQILKGELLGTKEFEGLTGEVEQVFKYKNINIVLIICISFLFLRCNTETVHPVKQDETWRNVIFNGDNYAIQKTIKFNGKTVCEIHVKGSLVNFDEDLKIPGSYKTFPKPYAKRYDEKLKQINKSNFEKDIYNSTILMFEIAKKLNYTFNEEKLNKEAL